MAARRNPAIARAANRVQQRTKEWPATLCNSAGDITPGLSAAVPGQPAYVYVAMPAGSVAKAFNNRVAAVTGLRVWAGYEPRNPARLTVLDFNYSYQATGTSGGGGGGIVGIGPHHATHEWPGSDVVYSQARQLMMARVSLVSGFVVRVQPSPVWTTAGWRLTTAATLDLSGDQPATGALYVLIYLDAAGVLAKRVGTNVGGPIAGLTYNYIPAVPSGATALAAVALYAGQTAISEDLVHQDVVDLRFTHSPNAHNDALGWFNVKDYGALGDGATDDTTAIAAAVAALNAGGGGQLYFPKGTYITTGGFVITSSCIVFGDGGYWAETTIKCTSATAVLFAVAAASLQVNFENMYLINTAATPTAGAAISVGSANGPQVNYTGVVVQFFYDNIVVNAGSNWVMDNCWIGPCKRRGVTVRNTFIADQGDWGIVNSVFAAGGITSTGAALYIESSGGGRIVNNKFNGAFTYGIEVNAVDFSTILLISNNSIEGMVSGGIHLTNTSTHWWREVIITGNQFGVWSTAANAAIKVDGVGAASGHLGGIQDLVINGNGFYTTSVTAPFAIALTNVENGFVGSNLNDGYGAELSTTTCTNIQRPATGSVTSVALTVPSFLSVAGSPIVGAGTLAITLATESANAVLAGPTSGGAATPAFRALVAADLPNTTATPGNYTSADITVDAQGRVTAAASGSSGAGAGQAQANTRWAADGASTDYLLPDVAEQVLSVSNAGAIVDPLLYTLGADGFTLTFSGAPAGGNVLTAVYTLAQL